MGKDLALLQAVASDTVLLWLRHRLIAAVLIGPLAWELPYATGVALKKKERGVPVVMQWLTNPTRNHKVTGSIPGLAQGVKDPVLW